MFQSTAMSISLFLLLKIAVGNDRILNISRATYQEMRPPSVADPLNITVQPAGQIDCKGNKVTFVVAVEGGTGTIHYQWQRKRPGDAGFASFGARDSTKLPVYNIGVGSEAPDGTLYQVVVSDQNSVAVSGSAALRVNQISGISPVGVASYTKNQGENLWLKVLTAGNSPSSYRWIKRFEPGTWIDLADNAIISGSLTEQINFTKLSLADSGIYKVRVTFPTINGNQCTETSSITRTLHVIPDTLAPCFVNLDHKDTTLCADDLAMATWDDSSSDIQPARTNSCRLLKNSHAFDLSSIHFQDNVTPSAALVLHWGIYSATSPFEPIADETGALLDDKMGQLSLHPEEIRFDAPESGGRCCQIVFWLEDNAGNLTPASARHKINVTIPFRPGIITNF